MIAWGAAFLALQLGSDKLAGPEGYLTKILRWLKETFLPFVTGVWVSIRDYDWGDQWQKVKDVFDKNPEQYYRFIQSFTVADYNTLP